MNYEPFELHVELTDRCNAQCPLCARTQTQDISKSSDVVKNVDIDFDTFKRVADEGKFKLYTFCGNYGDPLSAKDFLKMVEYVADENTRISIFTNGSVKTPSYWAKLGKILSVNPDNKISFDLDGLEDTHSFYRRNTNFKKILENAKAFMDNTTAIARWQYLVFKHNQHQIEDAKAMAKSLGFSEFRVRYSRWFPPEGKVTFYDQGKEEVIEIADMPPDRPPVRLPKIHCKSMHRGEVFLSARGYLWPCCWTAGRYGGDPDLMQIVELHDLESININKHSVREIMTGSLWQEIENFQFLNGPSVCATVCGKVDNRSMNEDVVL